MSQKASLVTAARLGATSFPVKLFKTTADPEDVRFERAGPNGGRLEHRVVDAGSAGAKAVTKLVEEGYGEIPEGSRFQQGLWVGEGDDATFVNLSKHLKAIDEEEALGEMEFVDFIRREALPLERVVGSYWLAPGDATSAKVLKLVHRVCRTRHRSALVAWTKQTNRALGIAIPHPSGATLVVEIAFTENTREIPDAALMPTTVEVTREEELAAERLITAMAAKPEAINEIEDDRRRRRRQLAEYVREHGEAPPLPDEIEVPDVIPAAAEFAAAIS